MYYEDDDCMERFADQYTDWLGENCKCMNEHECECESFNEWFDNLRKDAVEGMDIDYHDIDYQEQYA